MPPDVPLKICIYGAGAIGSLLAGSLVQSGAAVSVVARGEHLAAIQRDGLTIRPAGGGGEATRHDLIASESAAALGPQDAVVLALKAHQIEPALDDIRHALGPDTLVVTAQNGVPWWYFDGMDDRLAGTRLASVDPNGRLIEVLPSARCIGCVLYLAAEVVRPGVVEAGTGGRIVLGPAIQAVADAASAQRQMALAGDLAERFAAGGGEAEVNRDIRPVIWDKLWGNAAFNPISALTGAGLSTIATDPGLAAVARRSMTETERVAAGLGIELAMSVDERIARAARIGDFKSSMRQDFERGRPPETGALVAAVIEIGQKLSLQTPVSETLLALTEAAFRGVVPSDSPALGS